jgi:predicted transporter
MFRRNRHGMPSLEPKPEIGGGTQRLAGLVVLALGILILADVLRASFAEGTGSRRSLAMLAMLLPVCLLAINFGWRLLFNRPNIYGAIMGPLAWRIFGVFLLIATGVTAVIQFKASGGFSWRLMGLLAIAGACVAKAEHMVKRGEITFDPSTRP